MRMFHTHYPKGANVWVRLKSGQEVYDKFIEKKGSFVILKNHKFKVKDIQNMSYRNHNSGEK